MTHLYDPYGRSFRKLRISLTGSCNLACMYCTPNKSTPHAPDQAWGNKELMAAIRSLHNLLALQQIRLTGGEPTLYPGLLNLVTAIKLLAVPDLGMTTNGYSFASKARALKEAGLDSVNISLDALEPGIFQQISRRPHLHRVLEGIDQAMDAGLRVKINCVVVKGLNEGQILPLFSWARDRKIPIRFLELMKMGHLHHNDSRLLFTQHEILEIISEKYAIWPLGRSASATAAYWELTDGYRFGIIANETASFCSDCDRLRLDSSGNLYGCLSSNMAVSIRESAGDETALGKCLEKALQHKKQQFTGSELSMMQIGG